MSKTSEPKTSMERKPINIDGLARIGLWLDGYKAGRGNLGSMGNIRLEELWEIVGFLQGDVRYYNPKEHDMD